MRTLIVAGASALLFAALVTELATRVWPDDYFALLVLCAVAMFCSGLLNLRLARPAAAAPAESARPTAADKRAPAGGRGTAESARPAAPRGQSAIRDQGRPERPRPERQPARPEAPRTPAVEAATGPREQGTVKWFNRTKGFGFVIRESGDEIFVHQRSIRPTGEGDERRRPALQDGQTVSFVVAVREKGPQAEDVVPVETR